MATKHSGGPKFCISASTEATEMYPYQTFCLEEISLLVLFLITPKEYFMFFLLKMWKLATKFLVWRPNFYALVANGDQIM